MTTQVQDTFTEASATALHLHAPDTDVVGAGWLEKLGTWQVNAGGYAELVTSAGDNQDVATIDAGVADLDWSADVTFGSPNNDAGLVANYSGISNYWIFVGPSASSANWRLYERAAGSFTLRSSSASGSVAGLTKTLKITTAGDTITGYVDGGSVVSYTGSPRNLKTATNFGIRIFRSGTSDSGTTFDNARASTGGGSTAVSVVDSAAGTDALALTADLSLADSGSGADAVAALAAALQLAESGAAADAVADIAAAFSLADAGAGTESVLGGFSVSVTDAGGGADAVQVSVAAQLADAATAADALAALNALVALVDAAGGTDVVASIDTGRQVAHIAFTFTRRGVAFTLTQRAVAFTLRTRAVAFTLTD